MIKKLFPIVYIETIALSKQKNSVLCLENKYFRIFKLTIKNVINEEDRIAKIEEQLEIQFSRYNSSDFILKYELFKRSKDSEILLVYLLDLEKLSCFYNYKEKNNLKIISIIPSFFLCRNYDVDKTIINFDISDQNLVISKHINNELIDFVFYQNDISFTTDKLSNLNYLSFENTINTHLEDISNKCEIIFSGNKKNYNNLNLHDKNFLFIDFQEIDFKKHLNFLPNELQRKYFLYYVNFKFLTYIFISMIIFIFLAIFIYFKISTLEKQLNEIETEISLLIDTNENLRAEIADIESNLNKLEKEIKNKASVNFKVAELFKELQYVTPKNVKITSIDYDGKKIISILGFSNSFKDINIFLGNIQNSEKLFLENYDYILKNQKKLDFKLELSLNRSFYEF